MKVKDFRWQYNQICAVSDILDTPAESALLGLARSHSRIPAEALVGDRGYNQTPCGVRSF
jgi:hypothetical protein